MRCVVDSFGSPVTLPVTKNVQGPMMLTWHAPPPAPARAPAKPGLMPMARNVLLNASLLYTKMAPLSADSTICGACVLFSFCTGNYIHTLASTPAQNAPTPLSPPPPAL